MINLFIVGIPRDMTEIGLLELFTPHGAVISVRVITEQATGVGKGYGFVKLAGITAAQRAIAALNGSYLGERELSVRIATNDQSGNKPRQQERVKTTMVHKEPTDRPVVRSKRPRLKFSDKD